MGRIVSTVIRITEELKDAIYARADSESESAESILRRLLELPALPERLSVGKALPIGALDVGEAVTIPYPRAQGSVLADEVKLEKIRRGIYNYSRKTGRAYRTANTSAGLMVSRVK